MDRRGGRALPCAPTPAGLGTTMPSQRSTQPNMNARVAPYIVSVFILSAIAFGIWLAVEVASDEPASVATIEQDSALRDQPGSPPVAPRRARTSQGSRNIEAAGGFPGAKVWRPSDPSRGAWEAQDAGAEAGDEDGLDEDEAMAQLDNRPEQAVWRGTFRSEKHDPAWTSRIREELAQKAQKYLNGEIEVQQLDCRETVCRMFLTFDDDTQANAFRRSQHDSAIDYEYQDMNPGRKGAEEWGITYEVLVKRERPPGLEVDDEYPGALDPGETLKDLPSIVPDDTLEIAQSP